MPLALGGRKWQALAFLGSQRSSTQPHIQHLRRHACSNISSAFYGCYLAGRPLHSSASRRLLQHVHSQPDKLQPDTAAVNNNATSHQPQTTPSSSLPDSTVTAPLEQQTPAATTTSPADTQAPLTFTFTSDSPITASSSTTTTSPTDASTSSSRAQASDAPNSTTSASTSTASEPGPTSSTSSDPLQRLPQQALAVMAMARSLLAALGSLLVSLFTSIRSFPAWVQAQQLKRLKELHEEEPNNADKYAAYLAELNKVNPKEVVSRVDAASSKASSPAVVVEYLKALVATGKLSDYALNQAAAPGESHRSLSQLLKDLQAQAAGEQPDDSPGSSIRRPLHVTLQGAALPAGNSKPAGPLQALWGIATTLLVIVGLATAWIVGSQAVRRVTAAAAALSSSTPVSATSGSPTTDPKEYKKDEMPEASIKTFKDVLGCDESKAELQEIVEFLKNPQRFTRLGAKLPKGVLLTGPPGTGKTLLAKAVAGEAGVPFFYRAGSEFEELYVGVGSRRMRALFAAAKKKAPCIVFIDEIDAIGGNRKHWESHTRKTLNQLLVEMDGFEANEGVIVLAATNLPETLDPALKRPGRFDRQVAVPLPDIKGRQEILRHYLKDKPTAADLDVDMIARQTAGFSGADLSNLVNEAALVAAKEGKDAITAHMVDYSHDKIRMGVERKSVKRSPEALRRTAYHESGHAIVALNVPGAVPIHKATIIPRGHALGMVLKVGRDDEFSINKQQMQAHILVCMGGQVAEELIFGREQVTSGATDDLRQATEMARHMVMQCGLNEAVGPVYVQDEKLLSEQSKQQIDAEVRQMLVEARERVRELLTEKLGDLHSLAGALLDRETLTCAEIHEVLAAARESGNAPVDEEQQLQPVGMVAVGPEGVGGSGE